MSCPDTTALSSTEKILDFEDGKIYTVVSNNKTFWVSLSTGVPILVWFWKRGVLCKSESLRNQLFGHTATFRSYTGGCGFFTLWLIKLMFHNYLQILLTQPEKSQIKTPSDEWKSFASLLQVKTSLVYLENSHRKVQRLPHEHGITIDKTNYLLHRMKLQYSYTVISFCCVFYPGRSLLLPLHSSNTSSYMEPAPLQTCIPKTFPSSTFFFWRLTWLKCIS